MVVLIVTKMTIRLRLFLIVKKKTTTIVIVKVEAAVVVAQLCSDYFVVMYVYY